MVFTHYPFEGVVCGLDKTMTLTLVGKKIGMTRLFDKQGKQVVCTVISAQPNVIVQIKQKETDGYCAIQLGAEKQKDKHTTKPLKGHFSKAGVNPMRVPTESRVENLENYKVGQEVGVDVFSQIVFVDITGKSKGKGYQGVMKRHGFAGGPAAHGSGFHRHGGSCGMRSSPGRCLPGTKKAGRMGGERVTVHNLKVVAVDSNKQTLIVQGCIPGARGCTVMVRAAMKKKIER
jgi:large subunit ribosomal protein L3